MATTPNNLSNRDSGRLGLFINLILDHANHIRPDKPTLHPPLIKIPKYKLEHEGFHLQEINDLIVLVNKTATDKIIGNYVEETISEHMDHKNEERWLEDDPFDDITQRANELKRKEAIKKSWFQLQLSGIKTVEELNSFLILNLYKKEHLKDLAALLDISKLKPNTVEIHYSQRAVCIIYGETIYKPRDDKYKNLIRDIGQHFNNEDNLIKEKPFRPEFDSYNKESGVRTMREETLRNINRQLSVKSVPLSFELIGEGILPRPRGVKLKFI